MNDKKKLTILFYLLFSYSLFSLMITCKNNNINHLIYGTCCRPVPNNSHNHIGGVLGAPFHFVCLAQLVLLMAHRDISFLVENTLA